MMNKWLLVGVGILAVLFGLSYFMGMQMFAIPTILLGMFVVLLVDKFIYKFVPTNKKQENGLLAVVGIFALFMGSFAAFGFDLSGIMTGANVGGGTIVPGTVTSGQQATPSVACSVPDEIRGTAATVTTNAYNFESATPYSAAVDVNPTYLVNSDGTVSVITDTSAYGITTYGVGDVFSAYGGSSSYYADPATDICVASAAQPLEIKAHAVVAQSNLQITGYDDTGGTALSGGTNTSEEDYDITLGANGDETFYLKLKVNVAVKAFNLFSVHTATTNDIDECAPLDSDWTETTSAKFLKNVQMGDDDGGNDNATITFDTWVLDTPKLLTEWESVKYQFSFSAGTTDPATSATMSASDMCIVCFNDATVTRGTVDGKVYVDYYSHDVAESDIGMAGLPGLPVGKQDCTVIEGI